MPAEVFQPRKEGKASAVNLLLRNTDCEVIVLEGADTLPLEHTIEALVSPLAAALTGRSSHRQRYHPSRNSSRPTSVAQASSPWFRHGWSIPWSP